MQSRTSRKFAVTALAVVGALALLAGSAVAGYALNDSGGEDSRSRLYIPPSSQQGATDGDDAESGGAANPAMATEDGGTDEMAANDSRASMPGYFPPGASCPAPAGNVAINEASIDLSGVGLAPNVLGDGFEMQSISVRGEGDCDEEGEATNVRTALDSRWVHAESDYDVHLTQAEADEQQPNVRMDSSASFWVEGNLYTVHVSNHTMKPMANETEPAPPGEDPEVQAILDSVVGQIAPDLGTQCFYTQREGTWDDLARLDIGDPRGAIPGGFEERGFNASAFDDPAEDCGGVELDVPPSGGFNAYFESGDGGFVEVGASPRYELSNVAGQLNEQNASWSNNDWQFHVYASDQSGGLGQDAITAIATALDPAFDSTCMVQESELDAAQLTDAGFSEPGIPDGYELAESRLRVTDLPAGCEGDRENLPFYHLNWLVTDGDATYDASAHRSPDSGYDDGQQPRGFIFDGGMHWTDDEGTNYSVNASNRAAHESENHDAMITIARGMDPTLDPNELEDEGPGRPEPLPGGDDGDSAGSEDAAAPEPAGDDVAPAE